MSSDKLVTNPGGKQDSRQRLPAITELTGRVENSLTGGDSDTLSRLSRFIDELLRLDRLFDEVEALLLHALHSDIERLRVYQAQRTQTPASQGGNPSDGISIGMDVAGIKALYRKIAMQTHPDRLVGSDAENVEKMEALFKKAKEAYQEGRGGTLSRILAKLEGNGETIESLELQFQELFTRVIVERNFLGLGYLDFYSWVLSYANENKDLVTPSRVADSMEPKIRNMIDTYLATPQ